MKKKNTHTHKVEKQLNNSWRNEHIAEFMCELVFIKRLTELIKTMDGGEKETEQCLLKWAEN